MDKILILSLLLIILSCSTQKEIDSNVHTIAEIEFQDGFNKDSVSLMIENCNIFDENIVTSSKVHGTTSLIATVYKKKNKTMVITSDERSITCNNQMKETFSIIVQVNSFSQKLNLNISKGKYIGLNRGNNEIIILQSVRPFKYE